MFNPRKLQFLLLKIVLLGNICAIIALIVRLKKELIVREDGRENDQIRRVKFTKGFTKHGVFWNGIGTEEQEWKIFIRYSVYHGQRQRVN